MTDLYDDNKLYYLKVLDEGRRSVNGGSYTWPEPGVWTPDREPIPCRSGWHVCTNTRQLLEWLGPRIWLCEIDGKVVDHGDKLVAQRARLVADASAARTGRNRATQGGTVSIQAVAWVLDNSQTRGFDRLVMIALANRVNGERDDGECWPAQRTIAHDAGMSAGTVAEAVARIAAKHPDELVIIEAGGPRKSTRYRLPFASNQRSGDEHKGYPQRSGDERSARPGRAQRAAQGRAEPEVTGMNLGAAPQKKRTCARCPAYALPKSLYCSMHGSEAAS